MRILFCGDVVGRSGRQTIEQYIPELREKLGLDIVVINGENASGGFGITRKAMTGFVKSGVDVVTGGDHIFDQKETAKFIDDCPNLLRADNLPPNLPGKGTFIYKTNGKEILVIHLVAQLFMRIQAYCPFRTIEKTLKPYELGKNIDAIIVDFHGEATSEKVAMGKFLDGKVSLVAGTHTHVPTADTHILTGGTAYQTDSGMCGDYNSVIGFEKENSIYGFVNKYRKERHKPAGGAGTLCGVFVETDDKTGLAKTISQVRVGGVLQETIPQM